MESPSPAGVSVESTPSLRSLHKSVVTIKVGPDQHPFIIHKELLCHYSSYFTAALTGPFKESAAAVVELPDQDVDVVEVVERWLYSQKLWPDDTKPLENRGLSHMIKAYVFGERFGMPALRNAAVNAIVSDKSSIAGLAEATDIHYLYENSASGCHLQRLLVAMFAFNVGAEWFESQIENFPKEFVFQLTIFNIKRLEDQRLDGEVPPFEEDICQFHEHNDSTEMCAVKGKTAQKRKLDLIE